MKSVRLLLVAAFAILFSACGTPNAKITPKPDIKPVITSNERAINDIKGTRKEISKTRTSIKSTRADIDATHKSVKDAQEGQDKGLRTLEQVMTDLNKLLK
jgi:septal ring factor EnvC (AmiA/AmiB activator)